MKKLLMSVIAIGLLSQTTSCRDEDSVPISNLEQQSTLTQDAKVDFSNLKTGGTVSYLGNNSSRKIKNNNARLSQGLLYEFVGGLQTCTDSQGFVTMTAYVENTTSAPITNIRMAFYLQSTLLMVTPSLTQVGGFVYGNGRDFYWDIGNLYGGEGRLITFQVKWPQPWSGPERVVVMHLIDQTNAYTTAGWCASFCEKNITNIIRGDSPDCPNVPIYYGPCYGCQ
jgi:hypothetical protein